jgi:predicted lipoprotein
MADGTSGLETESFLKATEGRRASAALEVQTDFARDTEAITINCAEMAGYIVIAWDDEGHMQTAMSNGVRSPYSRELIGVLAAKKVEHMMFKDDAEE